MNYSAQKRKIKVWDYNEWMEFQIIPGKNWFQTRVASGGLQAGVQKYRLWHDDITWNWHCSVTTIWAKLYGSFAFNTIGFETSLCWSASQLTSSREVPLKIERSIPRGDLASYSKLKNKSFTSKWKAWLCEWTWYWWLIKLFLVKGWGPSHLCMVPGIGNS